MEPMAQWPAFKRLFDWACVDPEVRRAVVERRYDDLPEDALGLDKAAFCEAYFQLRYLGRGARGDGQPYVELYRAHYAALKERLDGQKKPLTPRMQQYLDLVSSRVCAEDALSRMQSERSFFPAVFELCDGCAIHCSFCGLDAGRLKAVFPYNEENAALFSGVLRAVTDLMGPGGAPGALYYATEPTDNPDYERFLDIQYAQTGVTPQTTTAAADFRADRLKALMHHLGEERMTRAAIRFSVTSLKQYYSIQAQYTMAELRDVELLANNPESDAIISLSGRAAKCDQASAEGQGGCSRPARRYTISCVAGVVVNFARKDMLWTEPEMPSEAYPLGISVRGRAHFDTAEDFREKLEGMIEAYALVEISEESSVYLSPQVTVTVEDNIAVFHGNDMALRIGGSYDWVKCAAMLTTEPLPLREIMHRLGLGSFAAGVLRGKLMLAARRGCIRIG